MLYAIVDSNEEIIEETIAGSPAIAWRTLMTLLFLSTEIFKSIFGLSLEESVVKLIDAGYRCARVSLQIER